MARFGIFCLPMTSHMRLFLGLAKGLKARGHDVIFFGISDLRDMIMANGSEFHLLEPEGAPRGTLGTMMEEMAALGHVGSMRLQIRFDRLRFQGILEQGPAAVKAEKIDLMIVDQAEACSGSVADACGLPWVSVCNGLALNREPMVPPFFTPWTYKPTVLASYRNELAYALSNFVARPLSRLINQYRMGRNLKPYTRMDDSFSPFAQISQQPQAFDFPRLQLPSCFHYVGPIRGPLQNILDFPWEKMNGKPLVFASLGTVVSHQPRLFWMIAEACRQFDIQLVISRGGVGNKEVFTYPGSPLVLDFVPQWEVLARAALTITHAGLNTVLESLGHGVPMLALPITFEQPAIAARIHWTHTGEVISPNRVTANRLKGLIKKLLEDKSYRLAAQRMRDVLLKTNGLKTAIDIIEKVAETGRPVLRPFYSLPLGTK